MTVSENKIKWQWVPRSILIHLIIRKFTRKVQAKYLFTRMDAFVLTFWYFHWWKRISFGQFLFHLVRIESKMMSYIIYIVGIKFQQHLVICGCVKQCGWSAFLFFFLEKHCSLSHRSITQIVSWIFFGVFLTLHLCKQ